MAFPGKELIITKIMFSDRVIEQVSHFNSLENDICCVSNYDIDN